MSRNTARWLIVIGAGVLPETLYLHVLEGDGLDWQPGTAEALPFASREDAERFGFDHLDCDFTASEHAVLDLDSDMLADLRPSLAGIPR